METEKTPSTETTSDLPETVKMDEEDIRTGLTFAAEARAAQARLQAISDMEAAFVERMREKYKLDPTQYRITDWITGFEKVTHGDEAN